MLLLHVHSQVKSEVVPVLNNLTLSHEGVWEVDL
jgi:hypothetical protein